MRPQPIAPSAPPQPRHVSSWFYLILFAILLGLVCRFVLAACSIGTNDAGWYWQFAHGIRRFGLIAYYGIDPVFNQPPLPAYWSLLALRLSELTGCAFPFIFKLPMLLADIGTALLLWKISHRQSSPRRAALVAAAFAWSLDSILVSGYHCNTDSLYAFLCLLAVYLIDRHGLQFVGGLTLAAALNIKLIPLFLLPALLLTRRSWRHALLFLAGLSLGLLPYVPMLLLGKASFFRNVIAYNSNLENWGLSLFLAGDGLEIFRAGGRYLILFLVLLLGLAGRGLGRWSLYQLCALSFAIFLVFTPGFGVQYTVILVPLLFAADLPFAVIYSLLAGTFLLVIYWQFRVGAGDLRSYFIGPYPPAGAAIGLLTWLALFAWLLRTGLGLTLSLPKPAAASGQPRRWRQKHALSRPLSSL